MLVVNFIRELHAEWIEDRNKEHQRNSETQQLESHIVFYLPWPEGRGEGGKAMYAEGKRKKWLRDK